MPRLSIRLATAAAVFVALSATTAIAGGAPSAEEKAKIESALRQEGYTSWKDIERDGKHWEVDDAVAADGKTYDLKLAMDTLAVSEKKPD